jgi:putative sigma-54 modulation protein
MKFEYTGRHVEVTPALRSHVENHFAKTRHLFDSDSVRAHVIINVEKGRHRSEIIVKWRDHVLAAHNTSPDMYNALTKSIEKVEKQALKLKDKSVERSHKKTKASKLKEEEIIEPAPFEPQIIVSKKYAVKPMTSEEAILQLKAEVNQFLVYRDAKSEKISVIYNRNDGNFGLIQP